MASSLNGFRRRSKHAARRVGSIARRACQPAVERLEDYLLLNGSYVVMNTNDQGPNSLRQAITAADNADVAATIDFNIPGTGPQTIQVGSQTSGAALPAITVPLTIDGFSEGRFQQNAPLYSGPPLVVLDGTMAPATNGLTLATNQSATGTAIAAGSVIQGLDIVNFSYDANTQSGGTAIDILSGIDYTTIQGNYLGVAADGTTAAPNGNAGLFVGSSNDTIGGPAAAQRNVISGNAQAGVVLGIPSVALSLSGVNFVEGNYIGTDFQGAQAVPNKVGVLVIGGGDVIGGLEPGQGNVISGNLQAGVIALSTATYSTIEGNDIGTNASGTAAVPNGDGVVMLGGVGYVDNNLISGNTADGVLLTNDGFGTYPPAPTADDNVVGGNTIGASAAGTYALPNGGDGIDNVDVGVTRIDSNLIAGNMGSGVLLTGQDSSGVSVGTNTIGASGLPNGKSGVVIQNGSSANFIGISNNRDSSGANTIAYNTGNGVTVGATAGDNGATANDLEDNAIFGNTLLGIDLGDDGVTQNDASGHAGPNDWQNFPVLNPFASSMITGTFDEAAEPDTTLRIDFYGEAVDASGLGLSASFISSTQVTTDGSGHADINAIVSAPLPGPVVITATATVVSTAATGFQVGDTSEFSAPVPTTPTTTSLSVSPNPTTVGQPITLAATVTSSGGTPGGTVDFLDGTTLLDAATLTGFEVGAITVSNGGAGYLSAPAVRITGGGGGGAQATAVLTNGVVTSIIVTGQGSYTTVPTVTIDPPTPPATTTTTAAATAMRNGMTLGSINLISGGTGYTIAPAVTITGGGGSGAAAIATISGGVVTGVVITNPGTDYSLDPTVTIAPPTGTAPAPTTATAVAAQDVNLAPGTLDFIAITNGGSGYRFAPAVTISGAGGSGATATAVVSNGVVTGITLTNPGGGYNAAPTVTIAPPEATATATLVATGSASFTTSALGQGLYPITAVYVASGAFETSTSPLVFALNNAPATAATTITLNATPTSVTVGQAVSLSAMVTSAGGTPNGTIDFFDGGTLLDAATLDPTGTASFMTSSLTVGAHSITAVYVGDSNFQGAISNQVPVTIIAALTTTTLTISPNPVNPFQPITLSATVTSPGGTPGGLVVFATGLFTVLGSGMLDETGHVTTTARPGLLIQGSYPITAYYSGTNDFQMSTSPVVTLIVRSPTGTQLTISPNPATVGQPITLSARVGSSQPAVGTVSFMDGSTLLDTATLDATASASFTTSSLGQGLHPITAVYGGSDAFLPDASPPVFLINNAPGAVISAVALTVTPTTANFGGTVSLSATVSSTGSTAGGTVDFYDGATFLGMGTLDSTGSASLMTSSLPPSSTSITAYYLGNSTSQGSPSAPVSVTIGFPPTTTTLTVLSATLTVGGTVTLSATVTSPDGTPTGSVVFSDGAGFNASATLDDTGKATVTTSSPGQGLHTITAHYSGGGNFPASTSTPALVISNEAGATATTTTLTVSPSTAEQYYPYLFSVTVTSASGTPPSGTLSYFNGSTLLASDNINPTGPNEFSPLLLAGPNPITVVYGGSANFQGSISQTVNAPVLPAVSTALAIAPIPAVVGQPATLSATVTADDGSIPAGGVNFLDGTTLLNPSPVALDSNGQASFMISSLTPGLHSITAVYLGSASLSTSTSTPLALTGVEPTTTALSASPNPTSNNQTITLSASVTATDGSIPTGTVNFLDGATILNPFPLMLDSKGDASFMTSSLVLGTHSITAVYLNLGNYEVSSSARQSVAVNAATTTELTVLPMPGTPRQPITLDATVSSTDGIPQGSVNFLDGTKVLNASPLPLDNTGDISLVISTLTPGVHVLTAAYVGSGPFVASTSQSFSESVLDVTSAALTAAPLPGIAGQPVTFTVTVANTSGTATPTGPVALMNGSKLVGTGTLGASGKATIMVPLDQGSYAITAVYPGSTSFQGSTSKALALTINTPVATTTTTLTAAPNPGTAGQPVTFTATVSNTSGSAVPTGTIELMNGSTMIGGGTLDASGNATIMTTLSAGSYTVTAVYAGNSSFEGSTSGALPLTINAPAAAATTTTVSAAPSPATAGQPITFTINVISTSGSATPAGSVAILNDGMAIGSGTLDSGGQASIVATLLQPGSFSITAVYAGNSSFQGSDSQTLSLTVNAAKLGMGPASPPPQATGIAGMAQSRKGLASITVAFNQALNPNAPGNSGLIMVHSGVKKHGKTVYTKKVKVGSISYSGDALDLTINLAKPFKGAVQVTVLPGLMTAGGTSVSGSYTQVVK